MSKGAAWQRQRTALREQKRAEEERAASDRDDLIECADRQARQLAWKSNTEVASEVAETMAPLEFEWGMRVPNDTLREVMKVFPGLVEARPKRIERRRWARAKAISVSGAAQAQ